MDDGMHLAVARDVPEPARELDAWRGRRNSFIVEEVQGMPLAIALGGCCVHATMLAIFWHAGLAPWRIAVVGGVFTVFMSVQRLYIHKALVQRCIEGAFVAISVGAQLMIVTSAALTGGVHSPFVPQIALPAIISLLFFGPIPASRWIAVGNGLLIVAMFALPISVTGAAIPDPDYIAGVLIALVWSLFILHHIAGKLSRAAVLAGESYACLREERVAEAEAQLRRLQSVGAKVAHELKNPLAAIKGLCQLVARTPESERTQERLAVVAAEIERMETILHEYLSFSRPLEDLQPESIDLAALARDVRDVLAGRADQAGVTVSVEGVATPAKGDPRRLKEALINLVANALEATPHGGRVVLRVRASGDGAVVLAVEDTGRGIAPEHLDRLGTSFFTTRADGTGLGVVLAQSVIAQHGGTLAYKSTVGQGTSAVVTLPAAASVAPEPAVRAALAEARA
ncbi:MAG TPA: HAMP domain-containing sensor histidine kinase [Kofleriaceae bacterium]|nr:HAMP domain-containing sensor histidine kinase [Kofleriaceae bacterium]